MHVPLRLSPRASAMAVDVMFQVSTVNDPLIALIAMVLQVAADVLPLEKLTPSQLIQVSLKMQAAQGSRRGY